MIEIPIEDEMSGGLNNLVFNKDSSIIYASTESGMVYGLNLRQ